MASLQANGITVEYEIFGRESDSAILLVMGLGGQLTLWPKEFCEALAAKGFRVIRYDNRDVGLSTHFDDAPVPDMMAIFADVMAGKPVSGNAYTLSDMAADGMGLLDGLGIDRAHVVGVSMGGMIAQLMAAEYPARILSLTSIMSSSGNPELPQASPEAMAALMAPPPSPFTEEAAIEMGMRVWRAIGSPGFRRGDDELRSFVREQVVRSFHPQGTARQLAAILADGDRRGRLGKIRAPTVVLHGKEDPLVPVEAGEDTARAVPGSELRLVDGMGHDLPAALFPTFVEAILRAVERAA